MISSFDNLYVYDLLDDEMTDTTTISQAVKRNINKIYETLKSTISRASQFFDLSIFSPPNFSIPE